MYSCLDVKKELSLLASSQKAKILSRFFKTGKGEYGYGDVFIGVTVPWQRKIAGKYKDLDLWEAEKLLQSKIHEERLVALFILIRHYDKGDEKTRKQIYKLYFRRMQYVNNWDLVDLSAPNIVGRFLLETENEKPLLFLAKSPNLWRRRIAVLATFAFLKKNKLQPTFMIAEMLLNDKCDLIHKAVGWMLREAGKRDFVKEEEFIKKNIQRMPRTMLRYAMEKFPEEKRKYFLHQ